MTDHPTLGGMVASPVGQGVVSALAIAGTTAGVMGVGKYFEHGGASAAKPHMEALDTDIDTLEQNLKAAGASQKDIDIETAKLRKARAPKIAAARRGGKWKAAGVIGVGALAVAGAAAYINPAAFGIGGGGDVGTDEDYEEEGRGGGLDTNIQQSSVGVPTGPARTAGTPSSASTTKLGEDIANSTGTASTAVDVIEMGLAGASKLGLKGAGAIASKFAKFIPGIGGIIDAVGSNSEDIAKGWENYQKTGEIFTRDNARTLLSTGAGALASGALSLIPGVGAIAQGVFGSTASDLASSGVKGMFDALVPGSKGTGGGSEISPPTTGQVAPGAPIQPGGPMQLKDATFLGNVTIGRMTVVQQDVQQSASAKDLLNAQNVAPSVRVTAPSSTSVPTGNSLPVAGRSEGVAYNESLNGSKTPWSSVVRNSSDPESNGIRNNQAFYSMDAEYAANNSNLTPEVLAKTNQALIKAARDNNIAPELLKSLAIQESGLDPSKTNGNAKGLLQLMPEAARQMNGGKDPTQEELLDPNFNANLSAKYLNFIANKMKDDGKEVTVAGVVSRYFQGPSATDETIARPDVVAYAEKVDTRASRLQGFTSNPHGGGRDILGFNDVLADLSKTDANGRYSSTVTPTMTQRQWETTQAVGSNEWTSNGVQIRAPGAPKGSDPDHRGIDISGGGGRPTGVRNITEGTVVGRGFAGNKKGDNTGFGNYVLIRPTAAPDTTILYGHLANPTEWAVNAHVGKGAILGTMGSTGHSSGPHVHIQAWKGARVVDDFKDTTKFTDADYAQHHGIIQGVGLKGGQTVDVVDTLRQISGGSRVEGGWKGVNSTTWGGGGIGGGSDVANFSGSTATANPMSFPTINGEINISVRPDEASMIKLITTILNSSNVQSEGSTAKLTFQIDGHVTGTGGGSDEPAETHSDAAGGSGGSAPAPAATNTPDIGGANPIAPRTGTLDALRQTGRGPAAPAVKSGPSDPSPPSPSDPVVSTDPLREQRRGEQTTGGKAPVPDPVPDPAPRQPGQPAGRTTGPSQQDQDTGMAPISAADVKNNNALWSNAAFPQAAPAPAPAPATDPMQNGETAQQSIPAPAPAPAPVDSGGGRGTVTAPAGRLGGSGPSDYRLGPTGEKIYNDPTAPRTIQVPAPPPKIDLGAAAQRLGNAALDGLSAGAEQVGANQIRASQAENEGASMIGNALMSGASSVADMFGSAAAGISNAWNAQQEASAKHKAEQATREREAYAARQAAGTVGTDYTIDALGRKVPKK